jgi:hypothetical protein
VIITLVFDKKRQFFAENWQKSQKIVTITSVPGHTVFEQQNIGFTGLMRLARFFRKENYLPKQNKIYYSENS